MKRFFKILMWIVIVIVILLVATPYLFKTQIFTIVKEEINKSINAKVEFADFGLSLISNFPNLTVSMEELSVVGVDDFENDTLMSFESFKVAVNLMSVISGDQIKINAIILNKPYIQAKVLQNGKANWDIAKSTSDEEIPEDTVSSGETKFNIGLKRFEINNATIIYNDKSGNIFAELKDLNYSLNGDFTQDKTILQTKLSIIAITTIADGIKYLNKASMGFNANVDADLQNMKFSFQDNLFTLNELELGFEGFVQMIEEDIDMDVTFDFKETSFKDLLSFVPAIYMADFSELQTSGTVAISGFAKGKLSENTIPAFNLDLLIDKAMFKYPDLPTSVDNIKIDVKASNTTGIDNDTKIDINTFHFEIAQNPMDMEFHLATPISDPAIDGYIKGVINFASLAEVVPMEDATLKGILKTNVTIKGNMSTIENEDYENFNAQGNIELTSFVFNSPDLPHKLEIPATKFVFSPKSLDLQQLDIKMGSSDFHLKGVVENYLPYVFSDKTLVGDFEFTSQLIDVDEFMSEEEEAVEEVVEVDSAPMEVVIISKNIDFTLKTNLKKVHYDNLDIHSINGLIEVKDGKADLSKLKMNLLNGSLIATGYYSNADTTNPEANFDLIIDKFDISKTYETFNTIKTLAPGAKNVKGDFSAVMKIETPFDQQMEPVLDKIYSYGKIHTEEIAIENSKLFTQIGSALKTDKYNNMQLKDVNISFVVEDGFITVEPFDIKMGKTNATISGKQGIDQTIDYDIDLSMPKGELGKAASGILNSLTSKAGSESLNLANSDKVNFKVKVTGTVDDPKVNLDLGDTGKGVKDQVKENIDKKAKEAKEKLIKEARAKADIIIATAEKSAAQVKKTAKTSGEKLISEAEKQGDALIKKAGNNFVKKKAAETTKKQLVKTAKGKAANLNTEADKKSKRIIDKAKKEADNLIKNAQK